MGFTVNNTALFAKVLETSLPPTPQTSGPTHARTSMVGGQAVFENDNYRIAVGDNGKVTIDNKQTGEKYDVSGMDRQVTIDNRRRPSFAFEGTTTFKLDDGTKVTIETQPVGMGGWMGMPITESTQTSKVTITQGDYGVNITGTTHRTVGDLRIDEARIGGQTLDMITPDGNLLMERPAGQGFVAIDRQGIVRTVDQQYINETDLKLGGAAQNHYQDAFRQLSSLLSIIFQGLFQPPQPQTAANGHEVFHTKPLLLATPISEKVPAAITTGGPDPRPFEYQVAPGGPDRRPLPHPITTGGPDPRPPVMPERAWNMMFNAEDSYRGHAARA